MRNTADHRWLVVSDKLKTSASNHRVPSRTLMETWSLVQKGAKSQWEENYWSGIAILNVNIYKGNASETWSTTSILDMDRAST